MNKNCFAVEKAFENCCTLDLATPHRLESRKLVSNLFLAHNFDRAQMKYGKYEEVQNTLLKVKANIMRRKTQNDTITSERLMDLPDPARAKPPKANAPKGTREGATVYRQVFGLYHQRRRRHGYSTPKAQ